jgi:hypothetical protein
MPPGAIKGLFEGAGGDRFPKACPGLGCALREKLCRSGLPRRDVLASLPRLMAFGANGQPAAQKKILLCREIAMDAREEFLNRAKSNLLAALAEFQGGKMNCEGLKCEDCCFYSGSNPAGERCEIVNMEIKICLLLKSMEKIAF